VNTVLIPGVNDSHVAEIARVVKAKGAFLHNIMPLISAAEHGTRYGLTGQRGPTPDELEAAQRACEGNVQLMRHCRQCRADAVGRLAEDRAQEFTLAKLPPVPLTEAGPHVPTQDEMAGGDDVAVRAAHRAATLRVQTRVDAQRDELLVRLADPPARSSSPVRVAVATRGGGLVNEHFGHAHEFLVYDVSGSGAALVGHRKVSHYCQGGEGDGDKLEVALRALAGCASVLVAKIGRCPRERLLAEGIEAVERYAHEPIDVALLSWLEGKVRGDSGSEVAA
jgi:nitrogen fixation protein NifB